MEDFGNLLDRQTGIEGSDVDRAGAIAQARLGVESANVVGVQELPRAHVTGWSHQ